MKIINQSYKIFPEVWKLSGMVNRIEEVARTCYQSEGKIKSGSDIELCRKLIKRKHDPMLEHAVIVLRVSFAVFWEFNKVPPEIRKYMGITSYQDRCIVSASIRVWRDLQQIDSSTIGSYIIWKLSQKLPVLFEDLWFNDRASIIDATPFTIIDPSTLSETEQLVHRFISVRFITDRGFTHEMVRHRPASYAQESTRYVKYNGDTEFIRPVFDWGNEDHISNNAQYISDNHLKFLTWCDAMEYCETAYKQMIELECPPQEARAVLPNSLKTDIVVTANLQEWYHIFKMRTAKTAHPQIRELMIPVLKEFQEMIPILFDDIEAGEKK